jgi:hypothetical protein
LFCNSRFICYDHPCNFSFCPPGWSNHSHWPGRNQHLHWYSDFVWARRLRGCLCRFTQGPN